MKLRPWSRHRLTSLQKFLRFWSFRKPWFVFQSGHRKNGRCRPSQYEGRSNVRHNYGGPRANVPLLESTGRIRGQGSEVTFPTSHTLQAGNWRIKEERKSSDLKAAHGIWWNCSHLHWFKAFSLLLAVDILQVPTFSGKSVLFLLGWWFFIFLANPSFQTESAFHHLTSWHLDYHNKWDIISLYAYNVWLQMPQT